MTVSELLDFYMKHKDKLVTLHKECGDNVERVWMESCACGSFEGVEMATLYTAPEPEPTRATHAHPISAIDSIEVIE